MLPTFSVVKPHFKFNSNTTNISNSVFKCHYRITCLILLICSILVTSRQYIGEHIRCMTGSSSRINEHVMNTFCFFSTTFTLVRHLNESLVKSGEIPHLGVGPHSPGDITKYHAYYQWVPFFLFIQAIIFYLPHLFWKNFEGGKIKALVDGLQTMTVSKYLDEEDLKSVKTKVLSRSTANKKIENIRIAFLQHIQLNNYWAHKHVFCEFLNLINVIAQIWLTNLFLSGQFFRLGLYFLNNNHQGQILELDKVFPKVTKCNFYKYGPSGTIEKHDILCIMALNVINEKIFIFLWIWYAILLILSLIAILWRFLTIFLHARSIKFNAIVFSFVCPGRLNPWEMFAVTNFFAFSDWLFLLYLGKNIDPFIFRDILILIAEELTYGKLLSHRDVDSYDNCRSDKDNTVTEESDNKKNQQISSTKKEIISLLNEF